MKNKDRIFFFVYLFLLVFFTTIHEKYLLLFALIVFFLISGKKFLYLFKKTFKSVIIFTSVVSVSYLISGFFKTIDYNFVILFNIRVFLMTYVTFLMLEKINIFKALSFSKSISSLIALSFSQINIFRRSFLDFWMGINSRQAVFSYIDWLKSVKSTALFFVNKTLHSSQDISAGMKSRGFFDD
jgi:cobalt/nickel transport system permease protein